MDEDNLEEGVTKNLFGKRAPGSRAQDRETLPLPTSFP